MAHAVFDEASLARQAKGGRIEKAKDFIDSAAEKQRSTLIEEEAGSLIDPEFARGRDMFHTKLERLLGAKSRSLVFYEHPFNPNLKFISKSGWHPKSGMSTVLYPKGIIPENTLYTWKEVKVPHPYNNHMDIKEDPHKQAFLTRKEAGRVLRIGWKRVISQLITLGWITMLDGESLISTWGSSRDDERLAQALGKV